MRRRRQILAVVLALVAIWVIAGLLRAESAGRAAFASSHAGQTVSDVKVDGILPAFPPFWQVTINGDVTEPGHSTPSYRSAMILWVEPISGLTIVMGAG
jgi:hypothetical protein